MAQTALAHLMPDAPRPLQRILDSARGPVPAPIRSEIFGPERFAQHGRSLGETHRAARGTWRSATFSPRLRDNIETLREAHEFIGLQASSGYDISPAGEWLLDNFHLIEAQLKEVHEGLPRSYFRSLPLLQDEPLAGLPRIYGVAWAFVAHTDGAFDEDLAQHFLNAYQDTRELHLSEMWALPTTLRVVLVENLRRLAERVATTKAAHEVANLCCDRLADFTPETLDQLLALMNARGAGNAFLGQMAQRLQDVAQPSDVATPQQAWLQAALPDLAELRAQQAADQAADNLSVSNAVTSLRTIGDADWPEIVANSSKLIRLMASAPGFAAEHTLTRDRTLHHIEVLARRANRSEIEVGRVLLGLMQSPPPDGEHVIVVETSSARHWLDGPGRPALLQALGLHDPPALQLLASARAKALPLYLSGILIALACVGSLMLPHIPAAGQTVPLWLGVLGTLLMIFPASEAVVAVVNRLIGESVRPRHMPRLALPNGIPAEHRVLVVIPCLLTSESGIRELVHRLQLHHLANLEPHAQYALLSDWADADTEHTDTDDALLNAALDQLSELNARYPTADSDARRFILLHRGRSHSRTEQRWIGWERKRGKLEQLVAALATGDNSSFFKLGDASRIAGTTPYVVTLDSDTQLPPGRLRELVSVAAHPDNQPVVDASTRTVTRGYGILQPRIATPLPAPRDFTYFHWLFAGQCGIDPYSAASSEIYQDLFEEGAYTGKALLHVQALHQVLEGRLPENLILSHDLVEGSMVRSAAVTDITLIEDAPFHADVASARVHRWMRGDWQLLPILLNPARYPLNGISRWKMFDNLRRSLVAPASLAVLLLALTTPMVSPAAALLLVLAAFCAGPMMGALAGLSPSRDDIAKRHFYRHAGVELARALGMGVWHLAQLLHHAAAAVDAIVRSLYRMIVSQRHLMQWTTTATTQATARTDLRTLLQRHALTSLAALALGGVIVTAGTPHPWLAALLCLAWVATPLSTWFVSRPRPACEDADLPMADRQRLEGIARDTWRLFERCVNADERHLPPDNLQTVPHDMVAHRTSPTNIGLYLLSTACARAFGWIGTQEALARLEATHNTLGTLERYRGHFLNWYDTQSGAALLPRYVSTVDSGNLCGHLLATAQALREWSRAPHDDSALRRALSASRERIAPLTAQVPELFPPLQGAGHPGGPHPLARLLALDDPLAEALRDPDAFDVLLHRANDEVATLLPAHPPANPLAPPSLRDQLTWLLHDHLSTLRSAFQDVRSADAATGTSLRLQHLAEAFEALAWSADFKFLYHPKRHLFHIGLRVAEQQLDSGFYDLLASESRLTSLLAIAKGDVPGRHWASLGRPFYAVGTRAGLRSWSGSMFEYLMPTLVLDEPHGSVLRDAGHAAIREQIDFGVAHKVPWGISESAYAGRDHTLAYQYSPQGVPRLALRRTPPDELVIAPYATALAAQIAPQRAADNYAALQGLHARAQYGFIEALDFSPARLSGNETYATVGTFMAHHQGMSIVSIANVLLDGQAQRWGMANPYIEAVSSLLHERAPREVSMLYAPQPAPPLLALQKRGPAMLREVLPGTEALEPTQVLSNGHYSVTLRSNGAGWSRRGAYTLTRTRDDALRDAYGSFFYLRMPAEDRTDGAAAPRLHSLTQHPAPDPAASYRSVFHADRACFDATWPQLHTHTTVWVSPEDDIEFRQVELHNLGGSAIELELISAFEVTLADPRADEAHPAFSNFFIRAQWLATHQALLFERTPRLVTERGLHAAHFIAESDRYVTGIRLQTQRERWWGRNHGTGRPMASLDDPPASAQPGEPATLDTGLDPVSALAVTLRIPAGARVHLTFATAAADNAATLHAVIDKYRQPIHVQRASLMSATLTGIRLRTLAVSAENFSAIQTLTTALVQSVSRPRIGVPASAHGAGHGTDATVIDVCDRRLLWRFGISGDRPILLVTAGVAQSLGLLRSLAQALRTWAWGGVACDLVVVNSEPSSYLMPLHREITALRERHLGESHAQPGPASTGFHVLGANEVSPDELSTLQCLARVRMLADGRPLIHHVQEWVTQHEQAYDARHANARKTVTMARSLDAPVQVAQGQFADASGEFRFDAGARVRPARPWINVLSNPGFGAQVSEAGGGYSWGVNSRLNQLTAWSNDPVADPPSEWFLLQDRKTLDTWSVTASAWGDEDVIYRVSHGQGYSQIRHRRGDLDVTASWCVDADSAVKQVRVQLINRGDRPLDLRLIGLAEWMMGANRSDRGTVVTSSMRQRLRDQKFTALFATQQDRSAGYGGGTAFFSLTSPPEEDEDWTCDRRECFDARGRLVVPDHYGRLQGAGLDPCAALAGSVSLAAGESAERVFLLGYGDSLEAARRLAVSAAAVAPVQRLEQARKRWDALLNATTVKTPDPLFDAMVNRWLLYQTVGCRMWAKAGFYQAGGATGYRDQLQDSMALAWAAPQMLREQIVLAASRQFPEGDVQHWWHAPTGAGVRTHFSDDLLWLPHACVHYLRSTGDHELLDEEVPFLQGAPIPEGAEDAYYVPEVSTQRGSVYEHAARTIDRSLRSGANGLPLMGTGDWNDGMNRVGHEGRGESVWLAWFACQLIDDFAPIARQRHDEQRAIRWQKQAEQWRAALNGAGWDGQWFKRAFFDDGTPLGSSANTEGRIDLIAQAWSVLAHCAPPALPRMAMRAVEKHLVDHDAGLIKLLDPPLQHAVPSAGYIQAYPPGIRENGGQYSHAGVWTLMAQAELAKHSGHPTESCDLVYRYFTYLSPAHRAQHPTHGGAYGIEPYVMAGDVYTQAPYVGRGGWSWYTGAAAWLHRAAVSSIFGLRQEAETLCFHPCLPSDWQQAEMTLQREGRSMRFILMRANADTALAAARRMKASLLHPGETLAWPQLPEQSCHVIPLLSQTAPSSRVPAEVNH